MFVLVWRVFFYDISTTTYLCNNENEKGGGETLLSFANIFGVLSTTYLCNNENKEEEILIPSFSIFFLF